MSLAYSRLCLALTLTFTVFLVACGNSTGSGGNSGGSSTIPKSMDIVVPSADSGHPLPVGTTVQLAAMAEMNNGTDVNVTDTATWTSSNSSVATVTPDGLVTVTGVGSVTITATKSGKSADVVFTCDAATVQSMTVSPTSASLALGQSKQFSATGTYSDGTTHDITSTVTWTSSSTGLATVSSAGLVHSVGQGSATVTATSGSVTAQATLTVGPHIIVSIVILPSNPSIPVGKTLQFTATATYSDGVTADITSSTSWSASPSTVLTINSLGLAQTVGQGSFSLTATAGGQSTILTGTVSVPVATSIQITPSSASIPKNSTQTFHATATMSDGSTQDVSLATVWQSSDTSVATVSVAGIATALAAGSAQITGTYQSVNAAASLTVTNATAQLITITPLVAAIAKGTAQQFAATATLSDGSTQNVTSSATWSSSATATATVNAAGLASGVAPGIATLTGQFGGKSGTAVLTISPATLVSITISPTNPTVATGGTLQLQATGTFSDGTTQNVTSSLVYLSSNLLVAIVDANGVVHGLTPGTATITATQGAVSVNFTVTISSATLQAITVTPASPTIVAGSVQQFTATGQYSDGSTQDLTLTASWTSSLPAGASIDVLGLATGLSAGSTTITATSASVSGNTDLTVSTATVASIAVTPLLAVVAAGQTQAFSATAIMSDTTTQDVTASAHWAVATPSVAQISNNSGTAGTATGAAAGNTLVSATVGSVTGSANLTVTAATVVGVSVSPATASVALGVPLNLAANATYSDGSTADVTVGAQWSSSSGSILSVVGGLVTPLSVGSTNVSASLGGQTGSAAITVSQATLSSIAITPTNIALALGLTSQLTATGTFSDGSTQDVTSSVHWSSASGSVATVSTLGLILSIAPGSTVVSASLGSVTQTVDVNISAATLQSITITAPQTSLALGFTLQLTATGNYSDGSTQNLTSSVQWGSTNATVGVVSAAGLVSGLLSGSFTASASLQGVTGNLAVTITPATLVSISIAPTGALSILLGHQMVLNGHFSDGSTQSLTTGVHWSVSNALLATISQLGYLLPISLGNINVTATYGSLSAQLSISLI